jgi:hypothetical protein
LDNDSKEKQKEIEHILKLKNSGFCHILIENKLRVISQRQLTDWISASYLSQFGCVAPYNGHNDSDHVRRLCILDNHNAGTATYHQHHTQYQ